MKLQTMCGPEKSFHITFLYFSDYYKLRAKGTLVKVSCYIQIMVAKVLDEVLSSFSFQTLIKFWIFGYLSIKSS
jgi:hypothetical protein